jgi:hypothetical protein
VASPTSNGEEWMAALRSGLSEMKVERTSSDRED